jgi:hypothetical protein
VGALHGVDGHFDLLPSPHFSRVRLPYLVHDWHKWLGTGSKERGRRGVATGAGSDTLGNDRLICCDVVRGDVLDGNLLLASATVVVKPFGQQNHRSRCLVGKL